MKTIDLEFKDIQRLGKRGFSKAESYGAGSVVNEERPLKGVTHKQRKRNTEARDILNIGSGTRCTHCGLLYFCWAESCSACGKPMYFNLGHRDEGARE